MINSYFIATIAASLVVIFTSGADGGKSLEVVYEWNNVDYTWADPGVRRRSIESKRFIPENNVIAGVKVYKDQVCTYYRSEFF